jgi:hypothetical protein
VTCTCAHAQRHENGIEEVVDGQLRRDAENDAARGEEAHAPDHRRRRLVRIFGGFGRGTEEDRAGGLDAKEDRAQAAAHATMAGTAHPACSAAA